MKTTNLRALPSNAILASERETKRQGQHMAASVLTSHVLGPAKLFFDDAEVGRQNPISGPAHSLFAILVYTSATVHWSRSGVPAGALLSKGGLIDSSLRALDPLSRE